MKPFTRINDLCDRLKEKYPDLSNVLRADYHELQTCCFDDIPFCAAKLVGALELLSAFGYSYEGSEIYEKVRFYELNSGLFDDEDDEEELEICSDLDDLLGKILDGGIL